MPSKRDSVTSQETGMSPARPETPSSKKNVISESNFTETVDN